MILHLADQLEVPLRERNQLLLAAGFAPVYSQTTLDAPQLSAVRAACARSSPPMNRIRGSAGPLLERRGRQFGPFGLHGVRRTGAARRTRERHAVEPASARRGTAHCQPAPMASAPAWAFAPRDCQTADAGLIELYDEVRVYQSDVATEADIPDPGQWSCHSASRQRAGACLFQYGRGVWYAPGYHRRGARDRALLSRGCLNRRCSPPTRRLTVLCRGSRTPHAAAHPSPGRRRNR